MAFFFIHMDTQTGQIHTLTDEETALFVKDKEAAIAALSERIGVEQDKLVPLDRLLTATCKRCNGSGAHQGRNVIKEIQTM